MNKALKPYLVICLPLVLKYVFMLIYVNIELLTWQDLIEDVLFFSIISGLINSSLNKNKAIRDVILFIYFLYCIIELGSYLAVSSNFSSSFMYVLIEASKNELKEFSSSFIKFPIIFSAIVMFITFLRLRKVNYKKENKGGLFVIIGFTLIIITILKFTGLIENNAYHNITRGIYGYYELQNSFQLTKNIDEKDIQIKSNNDVLVVVLGESTARGHMQLYNYYRKTTPNLYAIKDSLFVYNDVISTDVLTLKSVPKMLTSLSNSEKTEPIINIVDVFNKGGYETFWLSNQRPISYHDNAISNIASFSNHFKFYNHKIDKYTTVLDEVILPDYNTILKQEGQKVIFIRLIGTHFDYNKRYPPSFSKFNTENETTKEQIKNYYDNAILYNDHIVYTIIKDLKKLDKASAFIYLSDHGENVYDDGEFIGRNESNMTKSMFEIPFFLWTSNKFNFPDDFAYVPNRKFMTDHLYESLGHLFGIMHSEMDASKSIFSSSYEERKRIVVTGINYDEYFLDNHE